MRGRIVDVITGAKVFGYR